MLQLCLIKVMVSPSLVCLAEETSYFARDRNLCKVVYKSYQGRAVSLCHVQAWGKSERFTDKIRK